MSQSTTLVAPAREITLADSQHRAFHHQKIGTGRGYILFVAIVNLVVGICVGVAGVAMPPAANTTQLQAVGIGLVAIGIVYLGLWAWAKSQPFPAALTALIVYITVMSADAVLEPQNAANGILMKIIIIVGLGKAVQSGYAVSKRRA